MFVKSQLSAAIALLLGTSCFVAFPSVALAQDGGSVEVTGSRVKRLSAEGPLPIQTITREEIDQRGVTTMNELINNLTMVSQGSFAETQSAGNSFSPGTSGVSLRGLGTNATLVLINGRRVAAYAFSQNLDEAFVDLNSIPLAAIQRVEILKDGASAVYGSDALAGVVNIILRRDYKGLEVRANAGGSKDGGASERGMTITGGYGDLVENKFNIFGSFSVYNRNALMGNMRDFSANPDQTAKGGYDFRSPTGNPGTWLTGYSAAAYQQGITDNTVFPSCPESSRGVFSSDGLATCFYNFASDNPLLPNTERRSLYGRGTFAINENLTATFEIGLNSNTTNGSAAPTPGSASLPVGHVSNPFSFPVSIRYRYLEVGPRLNTIETDASRVLASLQGENYGWSWDVGVSKSKSETVNSGKNYISSVALAAAVPSYNFADLSKVPQSVIDGLRINTQRIGVSELTSYDFKASRNLFKMAGGNAGIALGFDRREESLQDTPDENTRLGRVVGSGGTSSTGQRSSDAIYAELVLPVFKGFEAQLAARNDNYSDFGNATTPKVAMSYRPNDKILFRGGWGKGFRAPSLVQLFLGQSFSFPSISDVVRCDAYLAAQQSGKLTASEIATNGRPRACQAAQVRSELGGNSALDAEKSESTSLGFVLEPTKNLTVAVDLWKFDHTNKIDNLPSSYILRNSEALSAAAGRSVVNRFAPTARDIELGAPGALRGTGSDATGVGFFNSYFNAQAQSTAGFDVELRYRTSLGDFGRLDLQSVITKTNSFKRQSVPGGDQIQYLGTWQYPKIRASNLINLKRGDWNYTLVNNIVGRYGQAYGAGPEYVKETIRFDAQVQYTGFKGYSIAVGGRNITNKAPSWADIDWYGFDTSNNDPRGAFWYARLNRTF